MDGSRRPAVETAAEAAGPDGRGGHPRRRRLAWAASAVAAVVVVLVGTVIAVPVLRSPSGGVTHTFEIPPGTAARLAAGEDVDVLPASLDLGVRDRLVVVNHDADVHYVGAFPIAPGRRLDKRFSDAGSLNGYCSLHASGRLSIEVGTRT